jgi:hypothetical protein
LPQLSHSFGRGDVALDYIFHSLAISITSKSRIVRDLYLFISLLVRLKLHVSFFPPLIHLLLSHVTFCCFLNAASFDGTSYEWDSIATAFYCLQSAPFILCVALDDVTRSTADGERKGR